MQQMIIDYVDSMEIKAPCAIRNMPFEKYLEHEALSNSGIKTLLECPKKYYYQYLSGEFKQKENPCFKLGKACHKLLLEGEEEFKKEYWCNIFSKYKKDELVEYLTDKGYEDSIKKLTVTALQDAALELEGIKRTNIELSLAEYEQVIGTSSAIKEHPKANAVFSQKGESEISLFWIDEKTGTELKGRIDYLPYDLKIVPDYKTSDSVNPRNFYKKFIDYGYHIQAAMYIKGIKAVFDKDVEHFPFIVQEKEAPYIVQAFLPCKELIEYGEKAINLGIEKFIRYKENNEWEAYNDSIITLSVDFPPEDLLGYYDKENAVCYAPKWLDYEILKYED